MPKDPLQEVKEIHQSLWRQTRAPETEKEVHEQFVLSKLRSVSVDLVTRGVTSTILEGVFLVWWLRVACVNHGFGDGAFERCLAQIGQVMGPIQRTLEQLGHEIQDAGPLPEMQRLGGKLEEARDVHGGWLGSWPTSPEEADAQTDLAHQSLQPLLVELIDAGIRPSVIESLLFYFWFRTTAINHSLQEAFFQKLERNWDLVMERVNAKLESLASSMGFAEST